MPRGRPTRGIDYPYMERLNIRVDVEVIARINRRAMAENRTVSDVAREALMRGLDAPAVTHGED